MPPTSAIINTTIEPRAPASVGVAVPVYIEKKMIKITKTTGKVPGNDFSLSFQVNPFTGGPSSGFRAAIKIIRAA